MYLHLCEFLTKIGENYYDERRCFAESKRLL